MKFLMRLSTYGESLAVSSTKESIGEFMAAISTHKSDLFMVDTEKFGPVVINRQHIVLIVPPELAPKPKID